ncbi:MAG TPA: hypothetical protein PLW83_07860 [Deltaproteobacteria bacterium]|nr:hypothetical protein [Deltaproteobacteria bacterium]
MLPRDEYTQAHLFTSAIRLFEHLKGRPPSLEGLSDVLGASIEELSLLSRKLEEKGIIGVVATGGQYRFIVKDHLKIEDLPRDAEPVGLEDEITRFRSRQESRLRELEESLGVKSPRNQVFSELEKALKDPSRMKKKNPLD